MFSCYMLKKWPTTTLLICFWFISDTSTANIDVTQDGSYRFKYNKYQYLLKLNFKAQAFFHDVIFHRIMFFQTRDIETNRIQKYHIKII